ncbi:MAG TPA: pyridoxal kinase PdxY [Rhodoblastus sp.]|nr:pyridoxal kinase PdxY [Rhodoblastus sp.]
MNILSIQSHVAYGHVGNSAAVFALQRMGVEVWPIHTVQFSNHPGYGAFRGRAFDAKLIDDCVAGVAERGALARCDGLISGYVGAAEIGEAILRAVRRMKQENPNALYCCDPVIGDAGPGIFVKPGVPEFFSTSALAAADVVTPNHFELEWLNGAPIVGMTGFRAAVDALHARGPKIVLVTSAHLADTPDDCVDLFVSSFEGVFRLRTPRLPEDFNGAGDAIAALFFAQCLATKSPKAALERAGAAIYGVLKRTHEEGARELLLVEAQDEIVAPTNVFAAEPL